jgi:putative FmdB family regulatory protein
MPIFEYNCKNCDAQFEKLVFRSDDTDIKCPACNSSQVEKRVSAASVLSGSASAGFSGGGCAPSPSKGFG